MLLTCKIKVHVFEKKITGYHNGHLRQQKITHVLWIDLAYMRFHIPYF